MLVVFYSSRKRRHSLWRELEQPGHRDAVHNHVRFAHGNGNHGNADCLPPQERESPRRYQKGISPQSSRTSPFMWADRRLGACSTWRRKIISGKTKWKKFWSHIFRTWTKARNFGVRSVFDLFQFVLYSLHFASSSLKSLQRWLSFDFPSFVDLCS